MLKRNIQAILSVILGLYIHSAMAFCAGNDFQCQQREEAERHYMEEQEAMYGYGQQSSNRPVVVRDELHEAVDAYGKAMFGEMQAKIFNGLNTQIALVLNKTSGNWGVAVGDGSANFDHLITQAFASCVNKDTGIPINQLQTPKAILRATNGVENCKLAAYRVPPRALALFRNQLPNGKYEFYGATNNQNAPTMEASAQVVPHETFKKEEADCKKEGKNCKLIQIFGMNDAGRVF